MPKTEIPRQAEGTSSSVNVPNAQAQGKPLGSTYALSRTDIEKIDRVTAILAAIRVAASFGHIGRAHERNVNVAALAGAGEEILLSIISDLKPEAQ